MKKLYILLLITVSCLSFGQTFYSENVGTATGTLPIATNVFQNSTPIVYTGDADTRSTAVSITYSGASGSRNVFFAAAGGKFFQISGLNTSAYTSANLQLTFGYLTTTTTAQMVVEFSTDGTTWSPVSFTNNTTTAWNLVTIPGGIIPASATLSLRFTAPVTSGGMRIDDIKLSNVSASCTLALGTAASACTESTMALDNYTVTIPYTGGGNATYTITTSGTVSGDNPTTTAAGNIVVTFVEGTNYAINITGGTCNLDTTGISPECDTTSSLPYSEPFPYTTGNSLTNEQKWSFLNSGDNILIAAGNLNYSGITSTGNSITFGGEGIDARTKLVETTSGEIYASFLSSITDITGITGTTYFAVLTDNTNSFTPARVWIKNDGTQYQYGISPTTSATGIVWSPNLYTVGSTQYIVLGYNFNTNSLSLFENPVIGGSANASISVIPTTALTSIANFVLRQDSNSATPVMIIDELTIAATPTFTLSSNSFNAIEGLKMYPNPVSSGILNIETALNSERNVIINDFLGKQVLNTTTSNTTINVSDLASGIYIVKVTENGVSETRKIAIK